MQYKTIALRLLEQQPELYEKLRQERQVIPAMEQYARELRMLHLPGRKRWLKRPRTSTRA